MANRSHLVTGIRLLGLNPNGSEFLRDFATVSEARENVPVAAIDWVIFELVKPGKYSQGGRVLDSITEV